MHDLMTDSDDDRHRPFDHLKRGYQGEPQVPGEPRIWLLTTGGPCRLFLPHDGSGRVVADGSRDVFTDAKGSQMVLKRDGNDLYGVMLDPAGQRATVAVELHRVPDVQAP